VRPRRSGGAPGRPLNFEVRCHPLTTSQSFRRPLTAEEQFVLTQVQDVYGPQNTEGDVFFTDRDEAALFATDRTGATAIVVVLTNLAQMYKDGTIATLDELREKWLRADI
jgi:hypothetical protein